MNDTPETQTAPQTDPIPEADTAATGLPPLANLLELPVVDAPLVPAPEVVLAAAAKVVAEDALELVQASEPVPTADSTPSTEVSMRQARLALLKVGLLQKVDEAVEQMPGDEGAAARIEWEYAQGVDRSSKMIAALSAALGLTGEQIDGLFTLARGL